MFVIVGSVNYKEHLDDYDPMPPFYSDPMLLSRDCSKG